MTLPSQSARPIARRSHMYRRPRTRRRRRGLVAAVVAAGAAFLGWRLWSGPAADEAAAVEDAATPVATIGGAATPTEQTFDRRPLVDLESSRTTSPGNDADDSPRLEMGGSLHRPHERTRGESDADRSDTDSIAPVRAETEAPANPSTDPAPSPVLAKDRAASPGPPVNPVTTPARSSDPAVARAVERVELGFSQYKSNRPADARHAFTAALDSGHLDVVTAARVRQTLEEINDILVFSRTVVPGDPFAFEYEIKSGDSLAKIVDRLGLHVDWRFIKRINGIADERRIIPGQRIKLITGPFHAVVDKDEFRLDLYLGNDANRVFVKSYPVGLGEYGSTPRGAFRVKKNSRLINPEWVNPRTRDLYLPDDPANPIGERWIGIKGTGESTEGMEGLGIHGTIEPDTIGDEASMGCVRMLPDDVEVVYELLMPEVSEVVIR